MKHLTLIAVLKYMTQKEKPLTVVDTHAGAGLYRLDGDLSETGAEAIDGVLKLVAARSAGNARVAKPAPALLDYLELLKGFNAPGGPLKIYPGSPFIVQRLLRAETRDKLKLFELHPTDARALAANIAQLGAGRQISVARQDGFESLKALLPPPNRRALVLIDPSYEIKSDYTKVSACIQDSLERFAVGTYLIWSPIIPRPEAHDLPRRLKLLAQRAGRSWLHTTLNIGHPVAQVQVTLPGERQHGPGLSASGVFVLNPPHTLKNLLAESLPQLLQTLGRGAGKAFTLESG